MATSASSKPITAPFGTWKSPLESETVYQKSASITGLLVDRKTSKVFHTEVRTSRARFLVVCVQLKQVALSLFFSQARPSEEGRSVLLDTLLPANQPEGPIKTNPVPVVPSTSNVRTRVHEYGDGAAKIYDGWAFWSEFKDGRIYRRALGGDGEEGDVGLDNVETLTPGECRNDSTLRIHPRHKY